MTIDEKIERTDRLNAYKAALQSTDRQAWVAALDDIRNDDITEIIPDLVSFLSVIPEKEMKDAIYTLFDELKLSSAIPALMDALQACKSAEVRNRLVRSCWYNNFNYADYLPFFKSIFIKEPFEAAYDAFTVIENMQGPVDKKLVDEVIAELKLDASKLDPVKKELIPDLIGLIEKLRI